ncbi:MAG: heat-shock protein [Methanobrevibacter sp.]|nr:heat-shock protein [Methanobrevibacter sp.]
MNELKFNRQLKYSLCEDKLKDFHEDLIMLDDWIPFVITSNLPQDVFFKLGKDVKNKKIYSDRLLQHKLDNGQSGLSLDEVLENEIRVFLDKYPKFKPLFSVNE